MKYSRAEFVSLSAIVELRPPKNGRSYLLIDNQSGNAVLYEIGCIPPDNGGITLPNGSRYEVNDNVPQESIYVRGTIDTPQRITISEDQFAPRRDTRNTFKRWVDSWL